MTDYTASADIDVSAPEDAVWRALTDPDLVEKYFFGARVHTDWRPGSSITWRGEFKGRPFEDKGKVVDIDEHRLLRVTHFSPLSGLDDVPENYHTLTFTLTKRGEGTHVELVQDNNGSQDEADQSASNWRSMLEGLKAVAEA
jgi:uncharacterized protein YndB with AHSA1/START domain